MKRADRIPEKIFTAAEIVQKAAQWRMLSGKIVFTNGVFDILHQGHIYSLSQAAKEADFLIVGLNSDASVKKLKGDTRPVNNQDARALLLASLVMVDAVVIFEEDTPLELIKSIMPDVLVKGGDYQLDEIHGREEVEAAGGKVISLPFVAGASTTSLLQRMKQR